MDTYKQEDLRKRIKEILGVPYERMYPFEVEKQLGECFKEANKNNDEEIKQEISWEIDLLNRTFGHKGTYRGKEVEEVSNKWKYYLDADKKIFAKAFSNAPFCEWKKEAIEYYKKRFGNVESNLSKARYAFAIMTLSSGSERLDYAKKSFESWLKAAEKYIHEKKYSEYYEIPPFAYDFSLKLALSFKQNELVKKAFLSLHNSILKIIEEGDNRWNLELFKIESKYLNQVDKVDSQLIETIKKESSTKIREIISELGQKKAFHFMRSYLRYLLLYVPKKEVYDLRVKFAETYIKEAESRQGEPPVQSAFYSDAMREYKSMQSEFTNKKEQINKKIKEISLKLKESHNKTKYKTIRAQVSITKKQIDNYIDQLRKQDENVFNALLRDFSLFPKMEDVRKQLIEQKKSIPLQFIIPVTVYSKDEIVKKHISEDSIFDYRVRHQILLGIKMGEVVLRIVFEELQKELDIIKEVENLLKIDEIKDINLTLKKGFDFIFGEQKDYISAAHILAPYIEEVIRRIIVKSGKVDNVIKWEKQRTTKQKTISFRKIELGGLLTNEEVKSIIGSDFADNLKVFLTDEDQVNYRNLLLHGRLESNEIEENDVIFIGYIVLKLLKILFSTKLSSRNNR